MWAVYVGISTIINTVKRRGCLFVEGSFVCQKLTQKSVKKERKQQHTHRTILLHRWQE